MTPTESQRDDFGAAGTARARAVFSGLLLLASVLFVTVVSADGSAHYEGATTDEVERAEQVGERVAGNGDPEATATDVGDNEHASSVFVESTPVVASVVAVQMALAAAAWWRPRRWLWTTGVIVATGGALLDLMEQRYQVDEHETLLVLLAGIVFVVHVSAAAIAARLHRGWFAR